MLTAQSKTLNITGASFNYKVLQSLIQTKSDLSHPNLDSDTYTVDTSCSSVQYVIKNLDTSYISIGEFSRVTVYTNNKNAKVVYTGTLENIM